MSLEAKSARTRVLARTTRGIHPLLTIAKLERRTFIRALLAALDNKIPRGIPIPSIPPWIEREKERDAAHSMMIKPFASGHLASAWRPAWSAWKYLTLALARYTHGERKTEKEQLSRSFARARSSTCAARVARVVRRCRSGLTYVCSSCNAAVSLTSAAHTSFHDALTHAANQPANLPTTTRVLSSYRSYITREDDYSLGTLANRLADVGCSRSRVSCSPSSPAVLLPLRFANSLRGTTSRTVLLVSVRRLDPC